MIHKSRLKLGQRTIYLKHVIQPTTLAQFGRNLTSKKKDFVLIITGYPGEGKSVLAVQMAKSYDKRFTYERNLIYSRKELIEKVENYPPSAFIIDESINILYKREWNKGTQKNLIKLLNICRSKKHMLIFVQPNFEDLDKDVRMSRLRVWIDVITRGVGVMYKPIKSLGGGKDPWNLDDNDRIIRYYIKKHGFVEGYLEGSIRTENFQNFIRWEDLSQREYDLYEDVKDNKKYSEDDETVYTEKEVEKVVKNKATKILAILKGNKYLKRGFYEVIASELNLGVESIRSYIRKWEKTLNLNKKKDSDKQMEDTIRID